MPGCELADLPQWLPRWLMEVFRITAPCPHHVYPIGLRFLTAKNESPPRDNRAQRWMQH